MKLIKSLLFSIIFLWLPIYNANAQVVYQKIIGGPNGDAGTSIQQTSDGGYIIAGSTNSFGAGDADVYLIKTDANCVLLWTKIYGGDSADGAYSVRQTIDGGYILAGITASFGAGKLDIYLIKTDSSGNTLWSKTYGGSNDDLCYSVQQTTDSGYIIAGYTLSFGAGNYDVYLIKTDANGNTLWTKTYGGTSGDVGFSVQQTSDGGYIIAGYTLSFGAGLGDVYLIKTNANGDTLWTKTYGGGAGADVGNSVRQTTDGGYIVSGFTAICGGCTNDVYLIKTDTNGDTLWTRIYGQSFDDWSSSVQQTNDGGYIIAGTQDPDGTGGRNIYIIKTNANGDTLWTKNYGDYGIVDVEQTIDGGYIFIGSKQGDIHLIKTDANGNSGCNEFATNTIVGNTPTFVNSGAIINSTATIVSNAATTVGNPATVDSVLCTNCNVCLSMTVYNISCIGGSDGYATVMASGGILPYTYLWSDSSIADLIEGLIAGTYTVTVTDSNGCTATDSATISEPPSLVLTTNTLPDTAGTGVGIAWVTVLGGTSPYSYQWNDPALQTTDTAYNLSVGTYAVAITDSNGCVDSSSVTVSNITAILDREYKKNDIHIIPNPNTGLFTLNMDLKKNTKLSIELYHITGQQIFADEINNIAGNYTHQIDLSKYAKGIYYVQVMNDNNIHTLKVIVY